VHGRKQVTEYGKRREPGLIHARLFLYPLGPAYYIYPGPIAHRLDNEGGKKVRIPGLPVSFFPYTPCDSRGRTRETDVFRDCLCTVHSEDACRQVPQ
jgi:hypothetical protein